MKITDIKINPKNPRIIRDEKFKQLCKSITDAPWMMELRPIIINENGVIQGGNMRYRALVELGYKEIPDAWVKQADQISPEQWREFVVSGRPIPGIRKHHGGSAPAKTTLLWNRTRPEVRGRHPR